MGMLALLPWELCLGRTIAPTSRPYSGPVDPELLSNDASAPAEFLDKWGVAQDVNSRSLKTAAVSNSPYFKRISDTCGLKSHVFYQ